MDERRLVLEGGEGEIEEKKSRFIAHIMPVETEEEAVSYIEQVKKKYWDARHNCSAFVLGDRQEYTRCSDDGEPSGTAGKPMLDVLLGQGLTNVVAVVTRYFGGTLLGTGGLVRAYQGAMLAGLEHCVTGVQKEGMTMKVVTDYNGIGKLQYICGKEAFSILDTQYSDHVEACLLIPDDKVDSFEKEWTEATSGKSRMEPAEKVWYVKEEKELRILKRVPLTDQS
ncbi:MAG: YigZ family protein [Clostridiales bacterium]|nr:YigZ family protein [Clostridiales bacterium]